MGKRSEVRLALAAKAKGTGPFTQETEPLKVERRSNTHRNYLSCVRNLEPSFGGKYLDEITPEMIQTFKEVRLENQ